MAFGIIRNDFVAGEISPELWGRHDVEMYHHAAARISNFIPRRTGGLRKRAGTELLLHIAASGQTRDYRVIPFSHDKDSFGLLVLWRVTGSQKVIARFYKHVAGEASEAPTSAQQVPGFILAANEKLADLRYIQIGDTLFFTYHGHKAFKCAVTFATRTLEFSAVANAKPPARPPELSVSSSGFASGSTYQPGTRKYRLWGVKDGVLSEPRNATADITLAWIAGAYVTVSFTPNWANADYYILGKMQGGQYGEISRYYPDRTNGSRSDSTWAFNNEYSITADTNEVDGVSYRCGASAAQGDRWKTMSPDAVADGIHACGRWVKRVYVDHANTVLGMMLWFGAKMSGGGGTANVGISETVKVKLYKTGTTKPLGEWDAIPQYNDVGQAFILQNPVAPGGGHYRLDFTDADGNLIYVPMRGGYLTSDPGARSFHDDNIQPGTLAGEQEALIVGDQGMDVDIITTWQQRLVAAASANLPFTMWFSTVGDLYNFYANRPQTADNAFEATIAATRAMRIRHIVAEKWLLIFTDTGEYMVEANGGALAYNTMAVRKIAGVGSNGSIPPLATESEVLFVAQDARSVYKMDYTLERDSVVPTNLSVRAEHVAAVHGIVSTAYQRFPDSILWCLLDDGTLASMTFFPDEQVCAWARHSLAGGGGLKAEDIFTTDSIRSDADTASTTDTFLVLRHPDKPGDVWVERLRPNVIVDEPGADAATCADHMGYAAADNPPGGAPRGDVDASVETLRVEPQQADTIGKSAVQFEATLRILRSGTVAVRPVGPDLKWMGTANQPKNVPQAAGGKVALLRTDVRISQQVFYNREGRVEIRSTDAWPCEILAFMATGNFGNMRNGG